MQPASRPYSARGIEWGKKGNKEQAVADYSEAIKLDPNDKGTYIFRGYALMSLGKYKGAASDFQTALSLDKNDVGALMGLSTIRASCPEDAYRDGKEALRLATKACELTDWKANAAIMSLAAAHAECGNFDEAVKWEEKAYAKTSEPYKERSRKRLEGYRNKQPDRLNAEDTKK